MDILPSVLIYEKLTKSIHYPLAVSVLFTDFETIFSVLITLLEFSSNISFLFSDLDSFTKDE